MDGTTSHSSCCPISSLNLQKLVTNPQLRKPYSWEVLQSMGRGWPRGVLPHLVKSLLFWTLIYEGWLWVV